MDSDASLSTEAVEIWTDGGCKPNPGPGGWGAVLRFRGVERELMGADPATTNNRMERKNWRNSTGDPVKNMDLWRRLLDAAKPHQVEWKWVRGHAGDVMNERVDVLATLARRSLG